MKSVQLNSGHYMPVLGMGTYRSEGGDGVRTAIDLGYRHVDCAHFYSNEHIVGDAIQDKIEEGKVKRRDLFIVSKLWNTYHDPKRVETAIGESLKQLKLEYVDLYLIHWPTAFKYGGELIPTYANGSVIFDLETNLLDTWKAMEKLVQKGLAKSIGVSNFNSVQLEKIIQNSKITPAVNQIECHPHLTQEKLRNFCAEKGVVVTAYCPLGRHWDEPGNPGIISDEKFLRIAKKHKKTPAQLLLRYQIQLGNVTIPKSCNPERLKENMDIFNFELSQDDMEYLSSFSNRNRRICEFSQAKKHPEYPFNIEF